jgi:hypothetical protein
MSATETAGTEVEPRSRARRLPGSAAAVRAALPSTATLVGLAAPTVIAVSAVTLIWSRLIVLSQSLWGDEAYAVANYIQPGPSAIWSASRWIPNNHVLYDFLSWATAATLSTHAEAAYRLWSAVPALAGTALMTWWLWDRFDRWAAAMFAVIATAAPLYFDLGSQARGYGLMFLSAAVIVVAADRLILTGGRGALVLYAVGGFVGIATLETFVAPFLAVAGVLMLRRTLRRQTIVAVVCVGVAAIALYSPLLSVIIGYQKPDGKMLPWYGIITGPTRDVFGAGIHALEPAISLTAGAIASGIVMVAGAIALWRRWERMVLLLLGVPSVVTYLLFVVATWYHPRYASFAMPALFALAAIGLSWIFRELARPRRLTLPVAVVMVVVALVTLARFARFASVEAQDPYEAASTAGQIVNGAAGPKANEPIYSNANLTAWRYYVRPRRISVLGISALAQTFCSYPGRFVYFEQDLATLADTTCLRRRDGFRIALRERRNHVWVWLVPALPRTP